MSTCKVNSASTVADQKNLSGTLTSSIMEYASKTHGINYRPFTGKEDIDDVIDAWDLGESVLPGGEPGKSKYRIVYEFEADSLMDAMYYLLDTIGENLNEPKCIILENGLEIPFQSRFAQYYINGAFSSSQYISASLADRMKEGFGINCRLFTGEEDVDEVIDMWDLAESVLPGGELGKSKYRIVYEFEADSLMDAMYYLLDTIGKNLNEPKCIILENGLEIPFVYGIAKYYFEGDYSSSQYISASLIAGKEVCHE